MKSTQLFGDEVQTYIQTAEVQPEQIKRNFNSDNFTAVMDSLTRGTANIIQAVGVSRGGAIPKTATGQPFEMQAPAGDPMKTGLLIGGSVLAAVILIKTLKK